MGTQFIVSKAAEMFIEFYAAKAIEVSKPSPNIHLQLETQHCFDALRTEHKFNFLRAVTVKPTTQSNGNRDLKKKKRKGTKRKLEKEMNSNFKIVKKEMTKRKRVQKREHGVAKESERNNSMSMSNHEFPTVVSSPSQQIESGYTPFIPTSSYYLPPPQQVPFGSSMNPSMMYQAPTPFHTNSFYGSQRRVNVPTASKSKQLDVQQIFGSDD